MATVNSIGSEKPVQVGFGGTGAETFTDHGVLVGSAATDITALGVATNGQLLIGSTGADPSLAALTAGTNMTVTNSAGGVSLATTIVTANAQTGTTYTLVLTDAGKLVTLTNAAAITLTVPLNASVAFATGTTISLYQGGAGTVTVAAAGGVTIRSAQSNLDIQYQYSMAALIKTATDTWILAGDLA